MRRLLEHYLFGNFHIAFCAVALTLTTQSVLEISIRRQFLVFIFCGTLFGYNFQRLPGLFDTGNRPPRRYLRHYWNTRHRPFLVWLTAASAVSFVWAFSRLYAHSQIEALIPAALSFCYALPVIPARDKWIELRQIPGIKIFVIAIVWAYSCAWLPAVASHRASVAVLLWTACCGMLIFALTVPFDIRDLRYDAEKLKALPALLNVRTAILVALWALAISASIGWLIWRYMAYGTPAQWLAYSLWCVIAGAMVFRSSPQRHEYYFSLFIDGLLLLLCGMVWAARALF